MGENMRARRPTIRLIMVTLWWHCSRLSGRGANGGCGSDAEVHNLRVKSNKILSHTGLIHHLGVLTGKLQPSEHKISS